MFPFSLQGVSESGIERPICKWCGIRTRCSREFPRMAQASRYAHSSVRNAITSSLKVWPPIRLRKTKFGY